jgi:hypothetical protein
LFWGSVIFAVQLRLASPRLLHVKKIVKWAMRNNLHQENNPEVKKLLDTTGNKK